MYNVQWFYRLSEKCAKIFKNMMCKEKKSNDKKWHEYVLSSLSLSFWI